MAIDILHHFEVKRINLLTNNPDKLDAFKNSGIEINERLPLMVEPRPENRHYLSTKKESLGHLLHQL
jgi:GTP cyclohydrolase II